MVVHQSLPAYSPSGILVTVPLEKILHLNAFLNAAPPSSKLAGKVVAASPFATFGTYRPPPRVSVARSEALASTSPSVPQARWLHRDSTFGAVTIELAGELMRQPLESLFAALFWDPSDFPCAAAAVLKPRAIADQTVEVSATSMVPVPELYRAKGLLNIEGRMHTLQV